MSAYDLGDVVRLDFTVRDAAGVESDATAVTATITLPDGTTATPTATRLQAGRYRVDYPTTQVGRHGVRFVATGTNATAQTDVFEVRDPANLPLVSLAEVRRALNVPATVTVDDEELRGVLDVATELVEDWCGRAFRRQTIVRRLPGGRSTFLLRPPVLSVTSVTVDGTALTAADWHVNADSGVLDVDSSTGVDVDSVVVTYVAGYANPPAVVRQAVLKACAQVWTLQRGPRPAFNGGDASPPTLSLSLFAERELAPLLSSYRVAGFA